MHGASSTRPEASMRRPLLPTSPSSQPLTRGLAAVALVCVGAVAVAVHGGWGAPGSLLMLSPVAFVGLARREMAPPPRALMLARAWNIDAEIQGDCQCERPFDKVTRIIKKEIVCKCPYYMVPSEPSFPGVPPTPTEMEYADGCKCVKGKGTIATHTTCTCPILPTDEPDFDSYTEKYDPAKVAAEDAKKAAAMAKKFKAIQNGPPKKQKAPPAPVVSGVASK